MRVDYTKMNIGELRRLARKCNVMSGLEIATASKLELINVLAGSKKESEEMKHHRNKELWDSISSRSRSIIASRTELGCNPDIFLSWYGIPPSRQDVYARAINMGLASDK